MKKAFFYLFLLLFLFVAVNFTFGQTNNEQRIVGTWTGDWLHTSVYGGDGGKVTWVFNSNGTGKGGYDNLSFKYGISSDKLIIVFDKRDLFSLPTVYDYFFSPDGTLFLHKLDYDRAESQDNGFILIGGTVVTLKKK